MRRFYVAGLDEIGNVSRDFIVQAVDGTDALQKAGIDLLRWEKYGLIDITDREVFFVPINFDEAGNPVPSGNASPV